MQGTLDASAVVRCELADSVDDEVDVRFRDSSSLRITSVPG